MTQVTFFRIENIIDEIIDMADKKITNYIPVMETLITQVKGSAPTQAGDSMLLMSNGQWTGTVGGGNLEWKLMQAGQLTQLRICETKVMPGAKTMKIDHGLGCATDQCCGGRVQANLVPIPKEFVELMKDDCSRLYRYSPDGYLQLVGGYNAKNQWYGLSDTEQDEQFMECCLADKKFEQDYDDVFVVRANIQPKLWIFGAGHISRVLAPLAVSLNYDVTVFDQREHWANADAFPECVKVKVAEMPDPAKQPGSGTTVLIMSHSHKLDYELLRQMHDWNLNYLGVIGSNTKSSRFRQRMDNEGIDDSNIHMPIGLPEMGKEPMEVAISVIAELLQRRNQHKILKLNKKQSLLRSSAG